MEPPFPAAMLATLPHGQRCSTKPPGDGMIKVAFAIGQHVDVMDLADASLPDIVAVLSFRSLGYK